MRVHYETPVPIPKRRYTVSAAVLAAARANLAKANAVPKEIRLRSTPARERARRQNLERAWARQRDPNSVPGGRFIHGACSRDLRRTAPLAGERASELDRLLDRLFACFPPFSATVGDCLRTVGDRIWRVRRVLASRVHQERLAFYEALFAAAEEPGGLGLERIRVLAAGLVQALDLHGQALEAFARQVAAQQRRLRQALKEWIAQMKREIEGEGEKPMRLGGGGLMRGPACEGVSLGEWLARKFVDRGWRLPESEGGYALHRWLVRAAVVGGNNVGQAISTELEQAIEELAFATWRRLGAVRGQLEEAAEGSERELAKLEQEQKEAAQRPESESAEDDPACTPAMQEWTRKIDRSVEQELGMSPVVEPWVEMDASWMAEDVEDRNQGVKLALATVANAVAAAA